MRARRPSPLKRLLKVAVSAALLGAVLWVIARKDGLGTLWERAAALDGRYLLAAVALQFLSVGSSVARWRLLLRAQGIELGFGRLLQSFLVGRFFGVFTPSTAGLDVYRAIDVGRLSGESVRSAGAIVVEKLCGMLSLALLAVVLLPLGGGRWLGPPAVGGAALLGVGALAGLLVLRHPSWLASATGRLPDRLRIRAGEALRTLAERPLDGGTTALALALGAVTHLLTAALFVASARALGLTLPGGELLVVGMAIVTATLVPVSVGGIGVREGAAVALLATLGVSPAEATLVAVLGFVATQPPALLGGLLHAVAAPAHGPTGSET